MKRIATFLASCLFCVLVKAQSSPFAAILESAPEDLEVLVDGKSIAIIPAMARNSIASPNGTTISIGNLRAGQHIITLSPLRDEMSAPPLPAIAEKKEPEAAPLVTTAAPEYKPAKGRLNVTQKFIELSAEERDSIKVEFFDNGIIDNDIINVFKDEKIVLHNKRISNEPLVFYTSLPQGQKVQRILMEAENLGTIAPNTALMVVTTKKAKYNLHLSSDFGKNAVVEFLIRD